MRLQIQALAMLGIFLAFMAAAPASEPAPLTFVADGRHGPLAIGNTEATRPDDFAPFGN